MEQTMWYIPVRGNKKARYRNDNVHFCYGNNCSMVYPAAKASSSVNGWSGP